MAQLQGLDGSVKAGPAEELRVAMAFLPPSRRRPTGKGTRAHTALGSDVRPEAVWTPEASGSATPWQGQAVGSVDAPGCLRPTEKAVG